MANSDGHRRLTIVSAPDPSGRLGADSQITGELACDAADGELLLVGELAKRTGKTVRAIHLYEDMGLLRPHERSKGRYRLFAADALVRVRWISKLQSLGLSLADIQQLVKEQEGSNSAMFAAAKLKQVYVEKLEQTRAKLAELKQLETELEQSLSFLNTCDSSCEPALPVTCCSSCERHPDPADAPDLVAGVHAH